MQISKKWPLFALAVSVVVAIVGALPKNLVAHDAVDTAANKRTKMNQIVAGILANNNRIGTVRLDLKVIVEDLTVSKREDTTILRAGGSKMTLSKIRYSATSARATIHDKSLRYDYLDENREVKKSLLTWGDGIWYEIDSRHVVRRRTDQMPGILPLDPRDACALELSRSILDICRNCEVVSIQEVESGVRVVFADSGWAFQLEILFSPRFGYIPVQSIMRFGDLIGGITDASYRQLPSGGWVLAKATTRYYSERVAVPDENVSQRWTVAVTQLNVLTDQEHAETFHPRELETLRLDDFTEIAKGR